MGIRCGVKNGHLPHPGNWDYEPKIFRKSEVRSLIPNDWFNSCIGSLFACMTLTLHKSKVQQSASVLFCTFQQVYCFIVGRNCVTITWQQIFKGSLQIMAEGVLRHLTVERSNLLYSGIARNFILCDKSMGESVAMIPQV